MKAKVPAFLFLIFFALLSAQNEESVIIGLYELCSIIHILISSIAMLLILCSGAVYAGGQLLGAETRARANVWAAGMLAGAIIGVLIVLIAPSIFDIMYPGVEYVC